MINYFKNVSSEIDDVIDKKKLDAKYAKKKSIFLAIAYKLLNMINSRYLESVSFEPKKLAKLSLHLSLSQLDSKLMEECEACKQGQCGINTDKDVEKCLKNLHASNIIDNVIFMIPMSIVTSDKYMSKIPKALNHANIKNDSNQRARLMLAMYETYSKKKFPPEMEKPFLKVMYMYDEAKKALLTYI